MSGDHRRRRRPTLALAAVGALGLAGCPAAGGAEPTAAGGDRLHVVASSYPLEWLTQQVTGDRATVTSLTPPGAEPHEYELTPADVAEVAEADAVVHLSGLQPSVDAAVSAQVGDRAFDAAGPADLDLRYSPGHEEEHAGHEDAGAVRDPHFWHDPMRMAAVGDALAAQLGATDPADAATSTANAAALRQRLTALDAECRTGLADAFGLHQVGISGLAPDTEPSPGALTAATDFVRAHGVHTVYVETLVSPAVAETVARETGAQTLQLDPIEGITDASQGRDHLEIMRADLADLRTGQQCS